MLHLGANKRHISMFPLKKFPLSSIFIPSRLKPELITEQYDCLEPREEQRAIGGMWRKGDGHLRDADTKHYIVCHLQLSWNFQTRRTIVKKTSCPLVNVTSYCCHWGVYRCSLEANLSPLMFRINSNCNATIDAFHSNVCIIMFLLSLVWESYLSSCNWMRF